MNKIDARSISVYTRQMVRLAATSGIYGLAVCASTCFMTDIKLKKVEYIHQYIIQENSRLVCTFPFGIYFSFFLPLVLSFFYSCSSFFSFFLSLCLSKTHGIPSFPTTKKTKAKISQCRPLCYSEKKVSSSSDHIK